MTSNELLNLPTDSLNVKILWKQIIAGTRNDNEHLSVWQDLVKLKVFFFDLAGLLFDILMLLGGPGHQMV